MVDQKSTQKTKFISQLKLENLIYFEISVITLNQIASIQTLYFPLVGASSRCDKVERNSVNKLLPAAFFAMLLLQPTSDLSNIVRFSFCWSRHLLTDP